MMNSADLVAKLLATENLTVIRTNSKTAYFDTKSRVLNIPLWKDMTPDIEGMLIGHEVGHALYTDGDKWTASIADNRLLRGYVNVVEDARIEKLMKRRYPGIRKTFNAGYKELNERDFFKLKGRDLNTLLPIDKINMYFKAGYAAGLRFTLEEKRFVDQIERSETFEEVFEIAKAILEYSKTLKRDLEAEAEEDFGFEESDDGEYEYEFDDTEYDEDGNPIPQSSDPSEEDDDEDNEESNKSSNGEGSEEDADLESSTDRALNQSLEELADENTEYRYYDLLEVQLRDTLVDYKTVLDETASMDMMFNENAPTHRQDFEKFMIESQRMVSYLVKEFEMRKSAQAFKRAKTAKSGSLNLNKLHAYKINDDIFKRITMIPNGKNHGMIFLLDWSGSMGEVIIPTVKQVINLAMFCRRIQIPFEVYAFSGSYFNRRVSREDIDMIRTKSKLLQQTRDRNVIWSECDHAMLNLFSSKMTNAEFKTSALRFTSGLFQYVPGYGLGDTPLNEALIDMLRFVPAFKKANNIEKLTFITLTDGQGGNLMTNKYINSIGSNSFNGKIVKIKNFIQDKVTGKQYAVTGESYTTTETILRMIKDRYDVTTLGFYIVPNRRGYLNNVFVDHFGNHADHYQIEAMRKGFKEDGFYSLTGTGRDDLFVIPDTSTKIVDTELEIDSSASAAAIARKFSKMFNTKKHSRVLLDRFISYVA